MMATFRPVNTALAQESLLRGPEEQTNPTTPRPNTAPHIQPQPTRDDATTPTRANFGSLAAQKPLPATSFPADMIVPTSYHNDKPLSRGDSQHSTKSRDSEDVDMEESDEGEDGSDEESINADGTRTTKKKKSQRFFCTDYPPCNLNFTRSEHLARHIRKHTGERPFQCHCSRRFSRLDNLRQHAQTVHQNEDIPQDSLAATGTRFQRQVRTDRVRPPGSRSRASTAGSQSGSIRGHQRNSLSASSITSVGSGYSQSSDIRRRPPPLVMAGDPRNRYSQEIYRPDSPSSQYGYRPHSPGGFSTPTSATFSTGQNSPRWGSGMQSPISSHSRTASLYGSRTPGRRLSVPSSGNPFQSPHGNSYGPPVLSQLNAANAGSFSPSTGMVGSPTSTAGSTWSRRESVTSASDEAWRRRTWHPETYSNFTSRLQNVTTPNYYSNGPPPQPPVVPSNAPPLQQSMRLPGIESFDPLPPRPTTPVRRQPSPMIIDTPSRPPPQQESYQSERPQEPFQHERPERPQEAYHNERPHSQHWDMGINRNLTRLDIAQGHSETASSWASEVNNAVQAQGENARTQPAVRFEESPYTARMQGQRSFHQHTISAPPITPKSAKRQGWYSGPLQSPPRGSSIQQPVQRTSPADSSSSEGGIPGTPRSNIAEVNPAILRSNGWVDRRDGGSMVPSHQPPSGYAYPPQQSVEATYNYQPRSQHEPMQQQSQGSNMLRLEALVAVATAKSEENGAIHI